MSHHGLEHDPPTSPRRIQAVRSLLVDLEIDPDTASLSEVQDAVYLAQAAGFDLGYRFEWRERKNPTSSAAVAPEARDGD